MGQKYQGGLVVAMAYGLPSIIATLGLLPPSPAKANEGQAIQDLQLTKTTLLLQGEQPLQNKPATSVTEWRAQVEASLTQITGIRLESGAENLSIILETEAGILGLPTPIAEGNQLTTLIPNAVLALPEGTGFIQDNPVAGIAQVSVLEAEGDQVQVVITGTDAAPTATVGTEAQNLVFSVAAGTAVAPAEPEPGDQEELEITVTAEKALEGFFIPEASTATRTDTPLRDTPQSVQVLPRELLDSQQVVRLDEALQNLSGVVSGGRDLGRQSVFSIRGFQGVPILRNGIRQFGAGGTFPETANLEKVEVLRGPSSILFGDVAPGGLINIVTKQPTEEPFYNFEVQGGTQGLFRPRLDISGPVTKDGNLSYRLNAVYQSGGDFQDTNVNQRRFFISPVLKWNISKQTDLTFELEYLDERRPPFFGIPAVGDGIADIPFDQISNEPDDISTEESLNVGYDFEHRFSDQWKVRNKFRYTKQNALLEVAFPFAIDETTNTITRFFAAQPQEAENFALQTNIVGEVSTGPVDHKLLFGVDLNRSSDNFNSLTQIDLANPLPLDIFAPVFGASPRPDFDTLPILTDQSTETDRLGVFFQDQVKLLPNLIFLAGGRFDLFRQKTFINPNAFDPSSAELVQNEEAFTPRVGLVYQPIPEISLYGSYSEVFAPSIADTTTVDGDPLPFESGSGFEVGVKGEFLQGALSATLAYFDITRRNVASTDPDNPFFFIATGKQKSRGVELDVVGEILPGWNILGSYAYIDAEISEDTVFPVGNQLPSAPAHSANLWTTYEIQTGALQGLGFGAGFNFVDRRAGDLANSFELDSYFLTNAALFYKRDKWKFALNFRNIFNIDYIADTSSPVRVRGNDPGAPFTVIGSVSVEF
ncbi:Ferrichrome-iron receptor [Acaryochloris thomasi RCC1774]|uniref:Ferrichrome-iron receptor n=1 Tax=Acaryochloris thomasi RCC1774 TaxID=1764569 RepID=A0A2W1JGW3_9CYAN|nr:TonB-dependent siderophore receptor [Acaryochloris thomasi]PZD72626.1 Ferrichrome-iron receptor [Acaryochloris thomasi RCC1774]